MERILAGSKKSEVTIFLIFNWELIWIYEEVIYLLDQLIINSVSAICSNYLERKKREWIEIYRIYLIVSDRSETTTNVVNGQFTILRQVNPMLN